MKPAICKQVGCAGSSCKHYRPTEKYPYYECSRGDKKDEKEKEEKDKGENDD